MNFAKQRGKEAQALRASVDILIETLKPLAKQQGLDLQVLLDEGTARRNVERRLLTERLQQSVLPLFIDNGHGRPDRIGSCVVVQVAANFYGFTAGHVIEAANTSPFWASPGGTKLLALPCDRAYQLRATDDTSSDLDVGLLPLRKGALGAFERCVFLTDSEIDEDDRPDHAGLEAFYFLLGYPGSRSQVKISHATRHIEQISFHLKTQPPPTEVYLQENLPQLDHLLLEYDHKDVLVEGKVVNPPRLQGVSGGGIFHISRNTRKGPLVAIATEHRENSRLLVGTRIRHFLTAARNLNATAPSALFE